MSWKKKWKGRSDKKFLKLKETNKKLDREIVLYLVKYCICIENYLLDILEALCILLLRIASFALI